MLDCAFQSSGGDDLSGFIALLEVDVLLFGLTFTALFPFLLPRPRKS
jgi:hypothetical protein